MSKGQKLKTNKSTQKRFRRTASGKFKKMSSGKRHLQKDKSSKRRRQLRRSSLVTTNLHNQIRRMMPYA